MKMDRTNDFPVKWPKLAQLWCWTDVSNLFLVHAHIIQISEWDVHLQTFNIKNLAAEYTSNKNAVPNKKDKK